MEESRGWHTVEGALSVGEDETLEAGSGTIDGRTYHGVGVRYRNDAINIQITISDWIAQPDGGLARDNEGLTKLAELVNNRLNAVRSGEMGGLEPMVLRLGAEDQIYTSSYEAYLALDGAYTPRFGVSPADDAKLQNRTRGLVDGYQAQQKVGEVDATAALNIRIYRFEDEASAEDFMAGMRATILSEPSFTAIAEITDADAFGDDSAAYAYEAQDASGPAVAGIRITTRVGAIVITAGFEDETGPELAMVEELVSDQLACVDAGACTEPVALPA